LRDIEACLSAQTAKLYHMGLREPIRRSTLADANESRDWRIYAEFAQRLIAQARRLYADESLGMDLTNTVYALDSTTIDLWPPRCLEWVVTISPCFAGLLPPPDRCFLVWLTGPFLRPGLTSSRRRAQPRSRMAAGHRAERGAQRP
jgi:hypothetical protein